jgi:hypothetical protein
LTGSSNAKNKAMQGGFFAPGSDRACRSCTISFDHLYDAIDSIHRRAMSLRKVETNPSDDRGLNSVPGVTVTAACHRRTRTKSGTALAHRRYGYRRLTVLLRREGFAVNHKRVLRLMGEDNLLCLRHRPFVPTTTQSDHDWLNPLLPFESRLRGHGRCRRSALFFSPTFRLQRAAAA